MMNVGFSQLWFFVLGIAISILGVGAFHHFAGNYVACAFAFLPFLLTLLVSGMNYAN